MTTLEELGLLKMDFLGLRNLTVLDDAVRLVRRSRPGLLHLARSRRMTRRPSRCSLRGVPPACSRWSPPGMTGVCVGLKPQNIEDITAIIALYRPGPMESIPRFIACKHNPEKVTYKHPALEPILSSHLRLHRLSGAGDPDLPAAGAATPWARRTWCAGPCPRKR